MVGYFGRFHQTALVLLFFSEYSALHKSTMEPYNRLLVQLDSANFDTFGFTQNNMDFVSLLAPSSRIKNTNVQCEYEFESLVENQRGLMFFGITFFSSKSLLPVLDPPLFLRLNGKRVRLPYDSIDNFVLPDFDWIWAWSLWYVLMLHDVDDLGWAYLRVWGKHWHGKYQFGDTVRRRVWIRMRQRG